jgi:hypothetical protein
MSTPLEDALKSSRAKTAQRRFGRVRAAVAKADAFIERKFDQAANWNGPEQIAAIVGFAGIVLFAPRLIASTTFYNSFGIGPGDVGLQFTDALGQAAVVTTIWAVVALLALLFVVTLIVALAGFFTLIWGSLWLLALPVAALTDQRGKMHEEPQVPTFASKARRKLGNNSTHIRHPFHEKRHGTRNLLAALATLIVIALQIMIICWGWLQGKDAAGGNPTGPLRVFGATLLDVRAEHVMIVPSDSGSRVNQISRNDACLLYLGQNNEITVLYDGIRHRSIRVPSSSLVVTHTSETPCPGARSSGGGGNFGSGGEGGGGSGGSSGGSGCGGSGGSSHGGGSGGSSGGMGSLPVTK